LDGAAISQCVQLINNVDCIVALTGAGISTAAGIPDFRGPKGLYITKQYDADKVFDIAYFRKDPHLFFEFARDFIALEQKIQPTFTHQFLVQLEQRGKLKGIITQNIDALHQKAGSKNVLEMHGSIDKSHCLGCEQLYSYVQFKEILKDKDIAYCSCGAIIKPDIVFFGENVKHFQKSADLAARADLFFVIGTSCVVQPAASIPNYVTGKIIIVNKGDVAIGMGDVVLNVQEDLDTYFREVAQAFD